MSFASSHCDEIISHTRKLITTLNGENLSDAISCKHNIDKRIEERDAVIETLRKMLKAVKEVDKTLFPDKKHVSYADGDYIKLGDDWTELRSHYTSLRMRDFQTGKSVCTDCGEDHPGLC